MGRRWCCPEERERGPQARRSADLPVAARERAHAQVQLAEVRARGHALQQLVQQVAHRQHRLRLGQPSARLGVPACTRSTRCPR